MTRLAFIAGFTVLAPPALADPLEQACVDLAAAHALCRATHRNTPDGGAAVCAALAGDALQLCNLPQEGSSTRARRQSEPLTPDPDAADRVAQAAWTLLSRGMPPGFGRHCTGFVQAACASVGLAIHGNVTTLWDDARRRFAARRDPAARVGDLAIFKNTYDKNRNGQWDDPTTHVAVVVEIEPDGTYVLAHHGSSGPALLRMNLRHTNLGRGADGRLLNSVLRPRRASDPPGANYLSGQLWVGFIDTEQYLASTSP